MLKRKEFISEQDAQKDIEAAEVILKSIKTYLEEKELFINES